MKPMPCPTRYCPLIADDKARARDVPGRLSVRFMTEAGTNSRVPGSNEPEPAKRGRPGAHTELASIGFSFTPAFKELHKSALSHASASWLSYFSAFWVPLSFTPRSMLTTPGGPGCLPLPGRVS